MLSRLDHRRPIGAIAGFLLGSLGFTSVVSESWPSNLDYAMAGALVVLAPALGWIFGPEAAGPRIANDLRAAVHVTFLGVVLGAFTTAAIASAIAGSDPTGIANDTIAGGIVGLAFLGLPALLLAMVASLVWVGTMRLGAWLAAKRRGALGG